MGGNEKGFGHVLFVMCCAKNQSLSAVYFSAVTSSLLEHCSVQFRTGCFGKMTHPECKNYTNLIFLFCLINSKQHNHFHLFVCLMQPNLLKHKDGSLADIY